MISFSDHNDETVHDVVLDGTPTYNVVDGGSKKGSRKLVSSEGYAFVVKRTLVSGVTEWRCSVRGKGAGCPAVIKQTGDAFVKGARGHSHTANPGLLTSVQNAKEVFIVESIQDFSGLLFLINSTYSILITELNKRFNHV